MEPANKERVDICIIVVSFNSKKTLRKSLLSLIKNAPLRYSYKIVLIDNASKDGCLEDIESEFPMIYIIKNDSNLGFGSANNIGMKFIDANYYYLHNVDAYLQDNILDESLDLMSINKDIGIAGFPLVFPDLSPQTSAYSFSTPKKWILQTLQIDSLVKYLLKKDYVFLNYLFQKLDSKSTFVNTHLGDIGKNIVDVDWVCGAAMLIRNETKVNTGGFDETIFLYGEDEDICIEAKRKGWRICQINMKPVIHDFGWGSNNKSSPIVINYKYQSLKTFINKHFRRYSPSWLTMRTILFIRKALWSAQ